MDGKKPDGLGSTPGHDEWQPHKGDPRQTQTRLLRLRRKNASLYSCRIVDHTVTGSSHVDEIVVLAILYFKILALIMATRGNAISSPANLPHSKIGNLGTHLPCDLMPSETGD